MDNAGNAYVTGQTYSQDFPTANPVQATNHSVSGSNAFVAKINAGGSAFVYSTYLGGSSSASAYFGDGGSGIAVDDSGAAYVTGTTTSTDFPTTASAFQGSLKGIDNGFVTKISSDGSALVYSTYLGGSGNGSNGDSCYAISVDSSGNAYVTGGTASADFPTTTNAFQTTRPNSNIYFVHAFVTKIVPDGSGLAYSTYLGSSGVDEGLGIAVDSSGTAYVTGFTQSNDFPTANPIQAPKNNSTSASAFVTRFTADGSALVYSTYIGGSCAQAFCDEGLGIVADSSSNAFVTGLTYTQDFPTTPNAFQKTNRGADNAFVAKISPATASADLIIHSLAATGTVSGSMITYAIEVMNNGPDMAFDVSIQDVIPAGATFNSVVFNGGSCTTPATGGTGAVTCRVPTLASGAVITETLTVNVTAAAGSAITDTATVGSTTFDPFPGNNSATITTTVVL